MLDRIFAVISILGVVVFMGIVAVGVMEPDLWIVSILVVGIGIYYFWVHFRDEAAKIEEEKPSEAESVIRQHST